MKCHQVRAALPLLVYGDVQAAQKAALSDHLAHCADCRRAQRELERVRRLLDTPSPPLVEVDVPRIYQTASARQARRWRWAAVSLGAVAALLLLVVGLRLDVRLSAGQLLVRWGEPPAPPVVPSEVIVKQPTRREKNDRQGP